MSNVVLRPCPFCGKSSSVEIVDGMGIYDFADYKVYKLMNAYPEYPADPEYHPWYVGCSKKKGGCGSYLVRDCFDKNAAIKAWNSRMK